MHGRYPIQTVDSIFNNSEYKSKEELHLQRPQSCIVIKNSWVQVFQLVVIQAPIDNQSKHAVHKPSLVNKARKLTKATVLGEIYDNRVSQAPNLFFPEN